MISGAIWAKGGQFVPLKNRDFFGWSFWPVLALKRVFCEFSAVKIRSLKLGANCASEARLWVLEWPHLGLLKTQICPTKCQLGLRYSGPKLVWAKVVLAILKWGCCISTPIHPWWGIFGF